MLIRVCLVLVVSCSVLAAVGLRLFGPAEAAPPNTVYVEPADSGILLGGSTSIEIRAEAPAGGIGSWSVDVQFDSAVLDVASCDSSFGVCNPDFDAMTVRFNGASAGGVSGTVLLASLHFSAIGQVDECTDLSVVVTDFNDADGNPTNPATIDGEICIEDTLGAITGVVTDESSGNPIEGICVNSQGPSDTTTATDALGAYTLTDLTPGAYRLYFFDCFAAGDYVSEYHGNTADWSRATIIGVHGGASLVADASLAEAATISGTVTDETTGDPLPDICITAHAEFSSYGTSSDLAGNYSLPLASGDYRLQFSDCFSPVEYIAEFHDNKPDLASADVVSLAEGQSLTIDAQLLRAGSISGTLTDALGDPVPDICVDVFDSGGQFVGGAITDGAGGYNIGGLSTDQYRVSFFDCFFPLDFIGEWYDNKPSQGAANAVAVTAGSETSGIDAVLAQLGKIAGTVTADATGDPIEGVCVYAFGPAFGSASTDANGQYLIPSLSAGNYQVQFNDCNFPQVYAQEWWDDAAQQQDLDLVAVVDDTVTTGIDAGLSVGAVISGTVTSETTDLPIAGVCVYLQGGAYANTFSTDSAGAYTHTALSAGDYRLQFYDCSDPIEFAYEYYDDKPNFNSADLISVALGDQVVINEELAPGGSISGVVTNAFGDPIPGICVDQLDAGDVFIGGTQTDDFGAYALVGLPSGDYRLRFADCNFRIEYFLEWYNDKPNQFAADPVSVTAGAETSGIDAVLSGNGQISGTVTDEVSGDPIENICVSAQGPGFGGTSTDANGQYIISNLPAGTYRVQFTECNFPAVYAPEWWDDASLFDDADLVAVANDSVTSGIDASLAVGATISGFVTDDLMGLPIEGICVDFAGNNSFSGASTDSAGFYSASGLTAGDYRLRYYDCSQPIDYAFEYYSNQSTAGAADLVSVSLGDVVQIDAALDAGGSISGVVTDSNGAPVPDICIQIYEADNSFVPSGFGFTDGSGAYSIAGLATADFKLSFFDCVFPFEFSGELYDDQPSFATADLVSVVAGSDTPNIDAVLGRQGKVKGTVTEEGTGVPLPGICVRLEPQSGGFVWNGTTDANGQFESPGLGFGGPYRVRYDDCNSPRVYATEWYNDKPSLTQADLILVANDTVITADAELAVGGTVSGTVTDEVTGDPIANICVNINGEFGGGFEVTGANGQYSIPGFATGDYRVQFFDCNPNPVYASETYNDHPDWDSADLVPVVVGADTQVDADLSLAGAIEGRVTDDQGDPIANVCVNAYAANQPEFNGFAGGAFTDANGEYRISGLLASSYRVYFFDCTFPTRYVAEWYDDEVVGSETLVAVATGAATTGVDAVLAETGAITGTVTNGAGDPLAEICVDVEDPVTGFFINSGFTNTAGEYQVLGLNPGDHRVIFTDCSFAQIYGYEYWDDETLPADADLVTVQSGVTTGGIDAVLGLGGFISGTITDMQGDPVFACANVNGLVRTARGTGLGGEYTLGPLPPGEHKVEFYDCGLQGFLGEWYNNKPNVGAADAVVVVAEATVQNIDAALDRDADGDLVGDTVDNCPNWANAGQGLPAWTIPANDPDCDGVSTSRETHVGTDPAGHCAATTGLNNEPPPDRWPVDFNDDQRATVLDLSAFSGVFGTNTSSPNWNVRFDFTPNGAITIIDVSLFSGFFARTCA